MSPQACRVVLPSGRDHGGVVAGTLIEGASRRLPGVALDSTVLLHVERAAISSGAKARSLLARGGGSSPSASAGRVTRAREARAFSPSRWLGERDPKRAGGSAWRTIRPAASQRAQQSTPAARSKSSSARAREPAVAAHGHAPLNAIEAQRLEE